MTNPLDLGSMLPEGYTAPDVQGVLGGDMSHTWCVWTGSWPYESCGTTGSDPGTVCLASGKGP